MLLPFLAPLRLTAALAATPPIPEAEEPPPAWTWRQEDRPVKVVVVAGSVGAFAGPSFHKRLAETCSAVEVRNLSKTGIGALQMRQRFTRQVLKNRRIDLADPRYEHWALVATGLNSIGMPEMTNHHIKSLVVAAHMRDMKTVVLSPTPWGKDKSSKFKGLEGLRRRAWTEVVVDYVMGRSTAKEALGSYARKRPAGPEAPWVPLERVDVGIDLYDSALRDRDAPLRDVDALRRALTKDRAWARAHAGLAPESYEAALAAEAQRAAEVPRWFMKPELRGFDYVHPNADGHRAIAQAVCPSLPPSWGCACGEL